MEAMIMWTKVTVGAVSLAALVGCGPAFTLADTTDSDAGDGIHQMTDSGPTNDSADPPEKDSGSDSSTDRDAGDSGVVDPPDTGSQDSGSPDSATMTDSGSEDSGQSDANDSGSQCPTTETLCNGICQVGACTLAVGQDNPWSIAVDGENAYWTNAVTNGSVMKCAINGCTLQPTTIAENQADPWSIVIDSGDAYVYWMNMESSTSPIARWQIGGGVPETLFAMGRGEGLALDATHIFFSIGAASVEANNGLYRCDQATGCGNLQQMSNTAFSPIATDGNEVFFSNSVYQMGDCPSDGTTCTPNDFAPVSGGSDPFIPGMTLAVPDDGNLYWSSATQILKCSKTNCTNPTVLMQYTNDSNNYYLAVDATNIYFRVPGSGGVGDILAACDKSNCNSNYQVLAVDSKSIGGIAVDATTVYWTSSSGAVMKIAK